MSLLEFQNVSFISNNKTVLKNISLSIQQGDYISLVGPSGSGKSTLLKLCCHLISPTEGTILFRNRSLMEYDPVELRKKITYCPQTPYLFGNTVFDNLAFPYRIRNTEFDYNRVEKLFLEFRLDVQYLEKEVVNLSGGEKQRIALMRALLFKPEILLLDEATSALDLNNTLVVENVIKSLNREGSTVIWITHDREQSQRNATKILTLEAGELKSLEMLK